MAGHTSFRKIKEQRQRTPDSEARVAQIRRAYRDILRLADLRTAMGVTQTELAQEMDVTQANVSRVEHEEDLYLSTLAHYVTRLGGTLRIEAVFPESVYTLLEDAPLSATERAESGQQVAQASEPSHSSGVAAASSAGVVTERIRAEPIE